MDLGYIIAGAIIGCCYMEPLVPAGLFDPSSRAPLIPLWLAVLVAEGEDPSMAFSLDLLNVMPCSKPCI